MVVEVVLPFLPRFFCSFFLFWWIHGSSWFWMVLCAKGQGRLNLCLTLVVMSTRPQSGNDESGTLFIH